MFAESNWDGFRNILCIRPDNLGDVLMTGPAIQALKEAMPGRTVSLLTSRAGAAVARFLPGVDRVIAFDLPWYKHDREGGQEIPGLVEHLREGGFDAAVIFTVYSQSPLPTAMLCYEAGIPRVAAYCRENPYRLISDWLPDEEPLYRIRHEVSRQLELVRSLGARPVDERLRVYIPPDAERRAMAKLAERGLGRRPWLLVHAGASEAKRRYPPAVLAKALSLIVKRLSYQVLLTGTASEGELLQELSREAGQEVFSLAGLFELDELLALIAKAPLLLSNNTGPVHIAAATGTPVVVLYALSNPQHTPWKVPSVVLPFEIPPESQSRNTIIRFGNERAFGGISPFPDEEDIFKAVERMLGGEATHDKPMSTTWYEKPYRTDTYM